MQVTETLNEGLKREFKVVVAAADLESEMMGKLKDMAGRAQIKGFRPGKVPVPHLKRLYGKAMMAEVVQKHVDEDAKKILDERQLKPAYQPEVKLPEDESEFTRIVDGKGDLAYSMAFEIVPEFELQDVGGLVFEKQVAEVTDVHVDESLARVADAFKAFEDKEGAAETGDRVIVSFTGSIDGESFEGGTAEDTPVTIGSGQFLPGFEEQLIGAKAGEDRIVTVAFPADYVVASLAGKEAVFAVKVSAVQGAKAQAIDDEFATRLGMEGVDAMKQRLREQIGREFERMTAMKLKRDVLDALDKQYSFPLPERLVEAEFAGIWNALTAELKRENKTFADEKTTEDDARKEYRAIAERRVRLGLVLGTMGEKEGVTIAEEELSRALMNRAAQFRGQERQVIDHYRKNPRALIELRGPIFEQKVVDLIVSKATVTEKPVTREELRAMTEEEDAGGHAHVHEHAHDGHDHGHDHDHDHHGHDHAHHGHDHSHDHEHDVAAGTQEKPIEAQS